MTVVRRWIGVFQLKLSIQIRTRLRFTIGVGVADAKKWSIIEGVRRKRGKMEISDRSPNGIRKLHVYKSNIWTEI